MPSWEFAFCFFISYAYIYTCIRRHLKETIPWSPITWSEMGKQIIQAKEVYWIRFGGTMDCDLSAEWQCLTIEPLRQGVWTKWRYFNDTIIKFLNSWIFTRRNLHARTESNVSHFTFFPTKMRTLSSSRIPAINSSVWKNTKKRDNMRINL